jgi:hypothetical protein
MDDGIGPVSFVLGESQENGSPAVPVAALAHELQPLRIDETRATLGWVDGSKVLHVKKLRGRFPSQMTSI